jgi:hypothetical protein
LDPPVVKVFCGIKLLVFDVPDEVSTLDDTMGEIVVDVKRGVVEFVRPI